MTQAVQAPGQLRIEEEKEYDAHVSDLMKSNFFELI